MNLKYPIRVHRCGKREGRGEGPEEVAGRRKHHIDSRVEKIDSKIYVLWLAKRKGGKYCIHDRYTLAF